MNCRTSFKFPAITIRMALGLFSSATHAQVAAVLPAPATVVSRGLGLESSLDTSYNFRTTAKVEGREVGDSDAMELRLGVRGSVPINEHWRGTWGLISQNLFLDAVPGAPIPDQINTLSLLAGASYRLNDQWSFNGQVRTLLYRFEDIDADAVGFSGGGFASYRPNEALRWNFGVMIAPESDLPVFPMVGVRWLINEQSTLDFGIPLTRFSYRVQEKWTLYTGLDMVGTTFRSEKNFERTTGTPRFNNELASYRDIRLGVGASYAIIKLFTAELELGGSVYRRIDFKDLDEEVRFSPSPYVRLGLSLRL